MSTIGGKADIMQTLRVAICQIYGGRALRRLGPSTLRGMCRLIFVLCRWFLVWPMFVR
jgi:hypothetical protein